MTDVERALANPAATTPRGAPPVLPDPTGPEPTPGQVRGPVVLP